MDCSTPGFSVHHQLLELLKLMSIESVMPPTILSSIVPFSSCLQSFPASQSFPMIQLFTSGGQSIGVSASTSVLPMNIQNWFPLEWAGWTLTLFITNSTFKQLSSANSKIKISLNEMDEADMISVWTNCTVTERRLVKSSLGSIAIIWCSLIPNAVCCLLSVVIITKSFSWCYANKNKYILYQHITIFYI